MLRLVYMDAVGLVSDCFRRTESVNRS